MKRAVKRGYSVARRRAHHWRPAPHKGVEPAASKGVTLAYCWSHLRRKVDEIYVRGNAPIATEAFARIKEPHNSEAEIRGLARQIRRALRKQHSRPIVEARTLA